MDLIHIEICLPFWLLGQKTIYSNHLCVLFPKKIQWKMSITFKVYIWMEFNIHITRIVKIHACQITLIETKYMHSCDNVFFCSATLGVNDIQCMTLPIRILKIEKKKINWEQFHRQCIDEHLLRTLFSICMLIFHISGRSKKIRLFVIYDKNPVLPFKLNIL